jgi:hypothetical protein
MSVQLLRLAAEIEDELQDIARVVERTEAIFEKARRTNDDAFLDAVALNLHGFYSGLERIFEDIARTVENSLPEGEKWRQDLLRQMTVEIPTFRPPVIRKTTSKCLEEYLKFRHVVRNVYTFNFRGSRLIELTSELRPCFDAARQDLTEFAQFLKRLTDERN